MDLNKGKAEIIKFFKISGLQIRSEVAIVLLDKYKEINDVKERRKFLDKILINLQNQTINNNSIELENIKLALRVSSS